MTPIPNSVANVIRQSQQNALKALDTLTKTIQQALTRVPGMPSPSNTLDSGEIVDQLFDMAEKLLESQRQFTKAVLAAPAPSAVGTEQGSGDRG